jgi:maltooligosyltrehalose trehalohydrolase
MTGPSDPARRPPPWRLTRGATVEADGSVTFSVWCPRRPSVALRLLGAGGRREREVALERGDGGVFSARVGGEAAGPGTDYLLVLPEVGARPDPVSRFQPHGVHGPSRVVAPDSFRWSDGGWSGIPLGDYVLYELHVGTFTDEGTFDGVRGKLDHLRALGITAVELMPVAAFPGARNWGYDGAALYAPHVAYGGPEGLKRLVDACHAAGMAVVLDVVYNHFGPEGSYAGDFGPYFTARHHTPWGDGLNFDGDGSPEVRRFFVDNALYWLTEYHVDALRLDAIHGIADDSPKHVLAELGEAFHDQAARLGRRAFVIAESDLNDVRVIRPRADAGYGLDAQWNDDFHHSLHAVLTGARRGYFADFGAVADLAKAVGEGFVYDGRPSVYRRRPHGTSSASEPGERLVHYLQNHDQVANAYQGKRLAALVSAERQKVAAALLFVAPGLPMLFMGQEMAEDAPFHYFTSHTDPELARAVREGRHAEYLHLLEEGAGAASWADPQAEGTFRESRLRWALADSPPRADMLRFHRELIALRKRLPALRSGPKARTRVSFDEAARYLVVERGPGGDDDGVSGGGDDDGDARAPVVLLANLGASPARIAVPQSCARWELALGTRASFPSEAEAGALVVVPPDAAAIWVGQRTGPRPGR